MSQLIAFLLRARIVLIFIGLEAICLWLIIGNNDYQKTAFVNGASDFVGTVSTSTRTVQDYFELRRVNEELAAENARLRELLQEPGLLAADSLASFTYQADSLDSIQYRFIPAEVVQNNFQLTNNFFMINKGSNEGITPGMGVISGAGIVGKIRSVSPNFAEGISVLNTKNPISIKHLPSGRIGTLLWNGINAKTADILYMTPDVTILEGDSIVTSSYNAIFPKDILAGRVLSVETDANRTYLNIRIDLSVDFARLSQVYVVKNERKQEIDSLVNSNPLLQP
jgi:rod shape-determining protein MreC